MKKLVPGVAALVIFLCVMIFGAWLYMRIAMHGFSARAAPSGIETMMADYARATAMPASADRMKNPIPMTPAVEQEAMAHFSDHCAVCHSNNGSGNTMFGNGLYPHPPDLRLARTQHLSDGEIFYIIENGVRMSGMPAFGGKDSAEATWKLVYFIRHLPELTPAEETEMESLNPKGPDEIQEEQQENLFLNGGSDSATPPTIHHMKGHPQ